MSRRIEVELTSSRADGVWTWRAAGARQPKGELDGSLLYDGAKVGDIVRADADFDVEGIAVTAVLPPKGARAKGEVLQILGSGRKDEPLVTSVLAPKSGRKSRDSWGDDRGPRRDGGNRDGRDSRGPRSDRPGADRPGGGRPGGDRPGGGRPGGDRPGGGRPGGDRPRTGDDRREHSSRSPRAPRPPVDVKPKARRLKPGRTYRQALLNALPETHRPLADLLMRGGIPNVRQALDRQNALLKGDDKPQIQPEPLLDMAERLMPSVRTAEWRDKAEAALAAGDDVDIRDLRSVVVAADDAARDEQSRQLAEQLRGAVTARVDREHQAWLVEIDEDLRGGRLVRALRLSSRPPKAGAPFPADLGRRLSEATTAGLAGDITSDRFATLLEALAVSPIRLQVLAASIPANPSPELLTAVKKSAARLPQIAKQFGIEPTAAGSGPRPPRANKPLPPKPLPPKPPPPKPEVIVDSTTEA